MGWSLTGDDTVRPGTRGGHGLFKWENIKDDMYRINYIGNSIKGNQGRAGKDKDMLWYSKQKDQLEAQVDIDELADIKQKEAQAMAEALSGKKIETDETLREEMKRSIKKELKKQQKKKEKKERKEKSSKDRLHRRH